MKTNYSAKAPLVDKMKRKAYTMLNFDYPINQNFDFYTGSDALDSPALLRSYDDMKNKIEELLQEYPYIYYGFKHYTPDFAKDRYMLPQLMSYIYHAYKLEQDYDVNITTVMYHLVYIFPGFITNEMITEEVVKNVVDIVGIHCMNFNILYMLIPYNGRPILHFLIPNVAYKHYKASNRVFSKSRRIRIEQTDTDILAYLSEITQ